MEVIKSLDNKKIKNLAKLLIKKYRDDEDRFLVTGKHLVMEAYKNKMLLELITTLDSNISLDVPTTYVTYPVLKKLTNIKNPEKVVGVVKKINNNKLGNKVLILDDIQDPGNLGTIIRSCVAFNVDTLVLSNNTVDLYNDKVLNATEGMIFNLNIIKEDIIKYIDFLRNKGYKIYGTNVDGGRVIDDLELDGKYAIIVGNEGNGVKKEILDICDEHFYIPINNNCESLNVGVATSIILYELNK